MRALVRLHGDGWITAQRVSLDLFMDYFAQITELSMCRPSGTFTASASLPIGAGLGSSAAYSTCIATSLLLAHSHISLPQPGSSSPRLSAKDINLVDGWAFLSEKVLHGNPSGIDNAVAVRGGAVAFTRSVGGKQGGLEGLNGWVASIDPWGM